MPTSIGHGLAGIAAGWVVAGVEADRRARWRQAGILAAVAAVPDLDLILRWHRSESHSLGAAAIVATVAAWTLWPVARTRRLIWLAIFAAYATHPLLDSLALDNAPPLGIMAFWPFSRAYVQSGVALFAPVWRQWWVPGFLVHNSLAVAREALMLAPVCVAVWWWRRERR